MYIPPFGLAGNCTSAKARDNVSYARSNPFRQRSRICSTRSSPCVERCQRTGLQDPGTAAVHVLRHGRKLGRHGRRMREPADPPPRHRPRFREAVTGTGPRSSRSAICRIDGGGPALRNKVGPYTSSEMIQIPRSRPKASRASQILAARNPARRVRRRREHDGPGPRIASCLDHDPGRASNHRSTRASGTGLGLTAGEVDQVVNVGPLRFDIDDVLAEIDDQLQREKQGLHAARA